MVNLELPTNPNLKSAVDTYNLIFTGVGVKNAGKGIVKFANSIPDIAKSAVKENKSLRDAITKYSLDWDIISKEIDSFSDNDLDFALRTNHLQEIIDPKNVFTYTPRTYELVKHLYKSRDFKAIVGIEATLRQFDPEMLKKLSQCQGFDQVLYDMTVYWTKFRGGEFQLKYAAKLINEGKKISFEVSNMSNDLHRVYDIVIEGKSVFKKFDISLELKNWSNIYPNVIKKQFLKDLAKMEKLGDFQWIFRSTKTNPFTPERLRTEFIAALRQKGVKMEIEKLFDEDHIFAIKMSSIFNSTIKNVDDLIEAIEDENNFSKIVKIAEGL